MLYDLIKKQVLSILLLLGICFGIPMFMGWMSNSFFMFLVGVMISFILFIVVIAHYYAIWFKDYIDYYWKKQDEKNESKDLQDDEIPDAGIDVQ